ncbi:transposon ty3-I gag-pol polyprotein [Tanacetum coccineum]
MVNTRTTTDPSTTDLNNTLAAIQTSIEQINGNINRLLIFQQFATGERLTNGEGTSNRGGSGSQYGRLTKFEFPKFYGYDVQGWLYRVNQFFLLDSIADDQKVMLVSMHMFNKALNWIVYENVEWIVYEREVQKRFDSVFEDLMVELKNLKQATIVQLYQEKFEALMNKVELSEAYAISLFIGGLKDEICMSIRMFKPNTLTDVYCLAKMQEATLQVLKTKQTPFLPTPRAPYTNTNSYANRNVTYPPKATTTTLAFPAPNTRVKSAYVQPKKQLTQKEIADKRAKNLCFYCDEKFVPGHKCSGQLFSLEICAAESNSEEYELEALLEEPLVQNFGEYVTDTPVISLHSMTRESTYKTMRVRAYVGKHTVHSLIDSGTTHTFLDLRVAKKLGCNLKATCPMDVSVANGQVMSRGCEMVLGVQWLSIVGDIKWNFRDLVMDFVYNNRRMVLRGTQKAVLQWMSGKRQSKVTKSLKADHGQLLCVYPNTLPYKHPPNQKDAVEATVKELMESGVIRDNKFLIPVVEELLDELSDVQFFSKLDLRPGYHQIRMHEEDIGKTAFRTHEGHYKFLVMPFGLTNAPSTFQALMNTVFKPFLRHFTLVFFDDILVYSATLEEHLQLVLQDMKHNSLYAKMSKCIFAASQVEYLGHIISGKGVSTHPSKITAMQKWSTPVNVKQLRGFLGLTGYYRRFIKDYANIIAMSQASVLALPDFNKPFTVETDASGMGIRAVLQQGGHPIAYLNKSLSPKHQALSTYEKEFYAVLMALEKWRRYLLDRHFNIKTDHFSLKYLLDQRFTTPFQAKWLPKLLGYDYEISYKKGSENHVADALSRISNGSELCSLILNHTYTGTKYTWTNGELRRKGKLVVGSDDQLRKTMVTYFHSDPIGGHSDLSASPGYLQPLPIPTKVWHDISMDFIEALPPSQGKTVLFVVVDRLSKYAHFIPKSHPFTASQVAQAFMDNVYKLHGHESAIESLYCLPSPNRRADRGSEQVCGMFYEVYDCFANTTPFEIVYGQPPSLHLPYIAGTSSLEEVDKTMQAREQAIAMSFEVGMKVYLKLQPYRQSTVRQGTHQKFAAKFYGPFLIIAKVGKVAYKLQLPGYSQIHPVFHVSQLKLCKGTNHQVGVLPHCGPDGVLSVELEAIIGRRLGKLNNKAVLYVLVKWVNQTKEDATWELYTDLIQRFPQMELHS